MRVLVVDDDHDAANALAMLVKFTKCEVRVAYDAAAGLDEALAFQPDLLMADLGMPGMDGTELARHIRQSRRLDKTILAAMTGYADEPNRELSLAAGFAEYLVKPASAQAIYQLLGRVADRLAESREPIDECFRQVEAARERGKRSF
jgi:CheY-like chemotaxis protein